MTVCHTPPEFGCSTCVRIASGALDEDGNDIDPELAEAQARLKRNESRIDMLESSLSSANRRGYALLERGERLHALVRRMLISAPRCEQCDQPATHLGPDGDASLACEWHAGRNHTEMSLEHSAVLRDAQAELRRKDA